MPDKRYIFTIARLREGGAEHVLLMLADYFSEQGAAVEVLVTSQRRAEASYSTLSKEIPVTFLPDSIDFSRQKKHPLRRKTVGMLCHIFEKRNKAVPDRLASDSFAMMYGLYVEALAAYLAARPGSTAIGFLQPSSQILLLASQQTGTPVILSERADPYRYFRSRYAPWMLKNYYPSVRGMVFQTEDARRAYAEWISVPSEVIPNPLPSGLPQPWEGDREKRIVNFCRLSRQKNIPLLLDAFDSFYFTHPDYTLEIIGDGERRDELLAYAAALPSAPHVRFLPHSNDVHEAVRSAAMFVSSSDFEGMSNSMLEAMALGMPVICTDCPIGGARAVIDDRRNGILVPMRDTQALAGAMSEVADRPGFAAALGREASQIRTAQEQQTICRRWLRFAEAVTREGAAG